MRPVSYDEAVLEVQSLIGQDANPIIHYKYAFFVVVILRIQETTIGKIDAFQLRGPGHIASTKLYALMTPKRRL
jgi:hypothetical protein